MLSPETPHRAVLLKTLMLLVIAVLLPSAADAFPSFARQVGRDCGYCHTAFPKLNDTGRTYLFNGYRFEAEGEWKAVKDQSMPVSFEVEVEGLYDNIKTAGVRNEASDLKVEEAEVIAGGAFGREGRVTALFSAAVQQENDGTFETVIPKAFVQINDLLGPTGAGRLNLRAGIGEVGLPFLRPSSTPISNAMSAERLIGAIGADERFLEFNGSVTSEGGRTIAHRYSAGIVREPVVESGNKLKGFYASWAATFDEVLSFGAIFRAGQESTAGQDNSYQRYGVAAEAETGPFIFTAGYFKSQREGAADGDDWLVEALYFVKRFTFGARYEMASFEGTDAARSQTFMARYDIMSSSYVQFEYRHRQDSDRIADGGELEDKARVILVALF